MNKQKNTVFIIFYLLVAYIFAQFFWWTYLILKLNQELYLLKGAEDIDTKLLMIIGEGSIFMVLLIAGAYIIRNTFKKEINLAEQQNNFLLSITHELKSPLASIKLQIETLLKRELDTEQKESMFSKILIDANRLNDLVDNVLLASRINDESFNLDLSDQNIVPILAELSDKVSISNEKSCTISFSTNNDVIILAIDSMAFPSILINLLENAIKYSESNSNIIVELQQMDNEVILSIKDEGLGISDDNKLNVFEKFYRIENEMTRKTKGTGLGLYIVNYLVNKHEGSIIIKDNTPKGSIFELKFNRKH